MLAEPRGKADGVTTSASKPPAAPKLRLNGHALSVHSAPHRELPDLPFLVDNGAVSMLPYTGYMAIPEALQIIAGQRLNSRVTATKTVHMQSMERYVVPGLIARRRELHGRTVVVAGAQSLVLRHGAMAPRVVTRARNGIVPMEIRNVPDEVQTMNQGMVLGVAFQDLDMKPRVDVDLKGRFAAPYVTTPARPDGAPPNEAVPAGSAGALFKDATVQRINVRLKPNGNVPVDFLPEHVQVQDMYTLHHNSMVPEDKALYKLLLAIVVLVKHFCAYWSGRKCLIRTDHASLKCIKWLRNPDDQFTRWNKCLETNCICAIVLELTGEYYDYVTQA